MQLRQARAGGSKPCGEGDGADMRGRAVSGCGHEEGTAAVARVLLGWCGLLGRARRMARLAAGTEERTSRPKELGQRAKMREGRE